MYVLKFEASCFRFLVAFADVFGMAYTLVLDT
jgi:hypothetical protein